jgi:hypothetical protein
MAAGCTERVKPWLCPGGVRTGSGGTEKGRSVKGGLYAAYAPDFSAFVLDTARELLGPSRCVSPATP